jgi:hypothetical protein
MVYFTAIWYMLVYVASLWYILWLMGTYIKWLFGVSFGMLYQEKSGRLQSVSGHGKWWSAIFWSE